MHGGDGLFAEKTSQRSHRAELRESLLEVNYDVRGHKFVSFYLIIHMSIFSAS